MRYTSYFVVLFASLLISQYKAIISDIAFFFKLVWPIFLILHWVFLKTSVALPILDLILLDFA